MEKRQILFYRPINNVAYIFVVRLFNDWLGGRGARALKKSGNPLFSSGSQVFFFFFVNLPVTLFYTVFGHVTNHFIPKHPDPTITTTRVRVPVPLTNAGLKKQKKNQNAYLLGSLSGSLMYPASFFFFIRIIKTKISGRECPRCLVTPFRKSKNDIEIFIHRNTSVKEVYK